MGQCTNHPERETRLQCMKHGVFMCDACAHCRDPEIYCKFRPSCIIHFNDKENHRGRTRGRGEDASAATGT